MDPKPAVLKNKFILEKKGFSSCQRAEMLWVLGPIIPMCKSSFSLDISFVIHVCLCVVLSCKYFNGCSFYISKE